jgi:hypothetical protein
MGRPVGFPETVTLFRWTMSVPEMGDVKVM